MQCEYCGLDFDYECEFIHALGCPRRLGIVEPDEGANPNLSSFLASKEVETSGESDSTEFHYIGVDSSEASEPIFAYGEHKGKTFDEVSKKYP
eukprot:506030-Karenia_brevis.AAC.1